MVVLVGVFVGVVVLVGVTVGVGVLVEVLVGVGVGSQEEPLFIPKSDPSPASPPDTHSTVPSQAQILTISEVPGLEKSSVTSA